MTKVNKPQPQSEKITSTKLEAQSFRTVLRTSITLVVCLLIFVHLIIALVYLLIPEKRMRHAHGIDATYKRYALPGPYFRDDLISASPHFYIAEKRNNEWSEWRNYEDENFQHYHQTYWDYATLKQSCFERYLPQQLYSRIIKSGKEGFTNYPEFKVLHQYFTNEYVKGNPDSIRLFYTTSRYKPRERKTKIDTMFFLTYKPW